MSDALQLLSRTRKSAEMGRLALERVIPMINERDLLATAQIQQNEYTRVMTSADALLRANGADENSISGLAKAASSVMIGLNTLGDKSPGHISQLLLEGTDRAIGEMDAAISHYGASSSPEAYNLASTLRDFLYRNRRELQRFGR